MEHVRGILALGYLFVQLDFLGIVVVSVLKEDLLVDGQTVTVLFESHLLSLSLVNLLVLKHGLSRKSFLGELLLFHVSIKLKQLLLDELIACSLLHVLGLLGHDHEFDVPQLLISCNVVVESVLRDLLNLFDCLLR